MNMPVEDIQGFDQELLERTIERVEAMEALAERVLAECRVTLMMSFRFLDRALWKMPFCSMRLINDQSKTIVGPKTALATDGHVLYYNAKAVIGAFRINPDLVIRAYLHALLHCIFRHPFRTVRASVEFWSLACDMCVEAIALEMCNGRFALEGDELVEGLVQRAASICGGLTPAKLYRVMLLSRHDEGTNDQIRLVAELEHYRDAFARDNHHLWDLMNPPKDDDQSKPPSGGGGDGDAQADEAKDSPDNPDDAESGDVPEGNGQEADAEPDEGADPAEGEGENGQSNDPEQRQMPQADAPPPVPQQQEVVDSEPEYSEGEQLEPVEPDYGGDEDDWAQIAKQVETELRTLEKERGEGAGTFMDNLALANRSRVNYDEFLRRFATHAEDAKLNDEEFDYIFYTYGLKLYDNMPLVEPLEYKECERIREFVIAIDTSGSCEGELVQSFLERTYQILCNSAEFGSTVDIHVIQCDAKIQSDVKITSLEELHRYGDEFEVRGLGGTDFQPVFAYVEDLQAQGELQHLQGLIYFTDGMGTFPKRKPPYETAFVFMDDTAVFRRVPPWAMKVVIDSEGIRSMAVRRHEESKEQA